MRLLRDAQQNLQEPKTGLKRWLHAVVFLHRFPVAVTPTSSANSVICHISNHFTDSSDHGDSDHCRYLTNLSNRSHARCGFSRFEGFHNRHSVTSKEDPAKKPEKIKVNRKTAIGLVQIAQ
jgi:hypothetical protein